jgi:hypothetical protein
VCAFKLYTTHQLKQLGCHVLALVNNDGVVHFPQYKWAMKGIHKENVVVDNLSCHLGRERVVRVHIYVANSCFFHATFCFEPQFSIVREKKKAFFPVKGRYREKCCRFPASSDSINYYIVCAKCV